MCKFSDFHTGKYSGYGLPSCENHVSVHQHFRIPYSIFRVSPKYGGTKFLQKIGIHLWDFMMSQPRRPQYEYFDITQKISNTEMTCLCRYLHVVLHDDSEHWTWTWESVFLKTQLHVPTKQYLTGMSKQFLKISHVPVSRESSFIFIKQS